MQAVTCPFCHRIIQPLELALRQSPHHDGRCARPADGIAWIDIPVAPLEDFDS